MIDPTQAVQTAASAVPDIPVISGYITVVIGELYHVIPCYTNFLTKNSAPPIVTLLSKILPQIEVRVQRCAHIHILHPALRLGIPVPAAMVWKTRPCDRYRKNPQ